MTTFTIQQLVVELDGGKLAAVVMNDEQKQLLAHMLPGFFEGAPIKVVALEGVKMVPLSDVAQSTGEPKWR